MYNDTMKGLLFEMGLPYDSSDEAAKAFYEALSDDLKNEIKSKLEAKAAAAQAEADQATTASTLADRSKPENQAALRAALAAAQKVKGSPGDPTALAAAALQTQKAQLIAEGERVTMLRQLGETLGVGSEVVQLAIAEGEDVPKAQVRYLKALREKCTPVDGLAHGAAASGVTVGEDKKIAALAAALPEALCIRADKHVFYQTDERGRVKRDAQGKAKLGEPHELAHKYAELSALDMYRQWLIALGAPSDQVIMMSRTRLAQLLGKRELNKTFPRVAQLAQSSSDFDNILLDAQNKSLRMGYVEAQRTWPLWAKRGTAPDFKNINRVQWSEIPNLTARTEGAPLQYVTITDSKETFVLAKYDAGVRLTWQALINDDQNVFGEIPFKMGQAGSRLEDNVAYAVLTANATMADTGALFNSTAVTTAGGHANLVAGTGNVGTPASVAVVAATEKLMMLQKGPKLAAYLDITPKFALVPVALKTVAQQFFASRVDPSKSNETPNPYNGIITVISTARLDASSATAWYLTADYRDGIDTVEICFLQDEPEPVLKQESDFDTDDAKYAVRHSIAGKALEFRGLVKNPGA